MRVIHHCQIEVRIYIFAEMDMLPAPVRMKRRFNVAVLADLCKHFPQHRHSLIIFTWPGPVEVIELFETERLFLHNLLVSGQV
ncbi:hypothetical protein D3C80_1376880 [compost metagenome]